MWAFRMGGFFSFVFQVAQKLMFWMRPTGFKINKPKERKVTETAAFHQMAPDPAHMSHLYWEWRKVKHAADETTALAINSNNSITDNLRSNLPWNNAPRPPATVLHHNHLGELLPFWSNLLNWPVSPYILAVRLCVVTHVSYHHTALSSLAKYIWNWLSKSHLCVSWFILAVVAILNWFMSKS